MTNKAQSLRDNIPGTDAKTGITGENALWPGERRSIWDRIPLAVSLVLVSAVILLVWQAVVAFGIVGKLILPLPTDVVMTLWEVFLSIITGGAEASNFWITTREILIAVVIASAIGFAIGVLIAETAFGRRVVQPMLVVFYAMPKVALAPIFVAWLGFGDPPKILMGVVLAFFPLTIATASGLSATSNNHLNLFKMMRASRSQAFFKLKMFGALPSILAGLKSAVVLAAVGVVVGEFLTGSVGMGAQVLIASSVLDVPRVFAFVIILSIVAYFLFFLVERLEKAALYWENE